jgi:uncharacterized protein with von Willebrand factor type A (vWA) domain
VVLAKSVAEKDLHERLFDQYFSAPARAGDSVEAGTETGAGGASAPTPTTGQPEVDALLALAAGGGDASGLHDGGSDGGAEALTLALQRAALAVRVDDIRFLSQSTHLARRMLEHLGIGALEARLLSRLGEHTLQAQAEAQGLAAARDRLLRHARALVAQRFELLGRPATEAFMTEVALHRALRQTGPSDFERMRAAVARMARRLAIKHSQRRRTRRHGQLDFRRMLRASAGHDAVPFALRFKQRRRDKPRLVVVCDVSASVAPHVRFLLLFLYALHGTVADLHTFAFSNRLLDVAAALDRLPFDEAMSQILCEVGNGATDYGQAWLDLRDRHGQLIDRRTTVLVLGDGRSNGGDPRLDIFAGLAQHAKRVVWLCPEPPGRWGSGDSAILRYRPFCTHMVHSATAADLERAIDEALQAYA